MQPSPPVLQPLCTSSVPLRGQISVALLRLLASSAQRNCWWAGKTLLEYLLWLPRLGNRFIIFLSPVSSQFTFNSVRSPQYPHWPYELGQENEIMTLSLKEPVCIKQQSKASQTAPLQCCYPKMRTWRFHRSSTLLLQVWGTLSSLNGARWMERCHLVTSMHKPQL